MRIFITGTDTNVGKTLISTWLCLQSGYSYFKPIQTGSLEGCDKEFVKTIIGEHVFNETYVYKEPVSPHLAASVEKSVIDLNTITLPDCKNLIIEGAGGVLVPLNENQFIADLINHLNVPVIIVASSELGTINHTLLTLDALHSYHIDVLGVIMNGKPNPSNKQAIEFYGRTKVLAEFPFLSSVTTETLQSIPLTQPLKTIMDKQ